jgi:hypothetical protein
MKYWKFQVQTPMGKEKYRFGSNRILLKVNDMAVFEK